MNKLVVPHEAKGTRIDVFLANYADGIATRNAAQKLLDAGKVQVGGKAVRKRHIVGAGDEVSYEPPKPAMIVATPENIPLDIIFEDDDIIIINKPKGMVVHPAPGHYNGTLVNALLFHAKNQLSSIGGEFRPGIVHRLDKDTSGLMAVAKNDIAHAFLAKQLANREMGRIYLALCHGRIKQEEFTIDLSLGRHPKDRKRMAVSLNKGKPAVTHVKVLEYIAHKNKNATFIEAKLSTGRTHQIRVHLAHINHPIVGDEVYGTAVNRKDKCGRCEAAAYCEAKSSDKSEGIGQILHAAKLNLVHPKTNEQIEFAAPLPGYFSDALNCLL